jgi:integrase
MHLKKVSFAPSHRFESGAFPIPDPERRLVFEKHAPHFAFLHEAAMFFEYLPITANLMELVKVPTVKGAPSEKPRIVLTKEEFRTLLARFDGMYRVMILLAGCVGLRKSEIFALLWSDFNWLLNEVFIQRANVEGYEDATKSKSSNARLPLHRRLWKLYWHGVSNQRSTPIVITCSPVRL